MRRMGLLVCTAATVTALGTAAAPGAGADGLPVVEVNVGKSGVALPSGGGPRYVAVSVGADTLVASTSQQTGAVLRSTRLEGDLTIPAVSYDRTAGGLSADGSTLALIEPRKAFPRRTTGLAVLDAEDLKLRDRVELDGDFSYDALSPDGSTLYLIQYESPRDASQYGVRAYDLERGRLLKDPIVDPTEPDEDMAGFPMARAMSPDGRWAYTLYEGVKHEPFVHALDTETGTAACIDLTQIEGMPGWKLGLDVAPSDGALTVLVKDDPKLRIAPEGFAVTRIEPPAPEAAAEDGGPPWALIALAAGGVLGIAALLRLHRRRGGGGPVSEAELEELVDLDATPEAARERAGIS